MCIKPLQEWIKPRARLLLKFLGEYRSRVVTEVANYIIFYRDLPGGSGVEIIRVLHGARDLDTLFSG